MNKHTSEDIARAVSLFFAVRCAVRTKLAQGKKLNPTSWLRVETLKFIADHEGLSMRDVADYLSITAPSATSLVSGLIKEGLVTKRVDTRDRRALRLTLSRKGKSFLHKKMARGTVVLGELFAPLSQNELKAFIVALEHIRKNA